ncbi:putative ribonuclease H-like domain-containing protein [Tanacetum coccineum]
MAQTFIKMKEEKAKEKGVLIKDIEDSSRPARSILTLKPLLTIDPKYKGKSILEEPEPAKKMTRKKERQREEEASKAAIAETYDEVQEGIDDNALFVAKLQQEEREEYTIEERAKFLAEIIAAQRKFRAAQRYAEIRKIQGLYERQKRLIDDFKPMDSDDAVKDSKEAAGVHKFQSLLSQLEIHGTGVSTKDANQKFLRSLHSSWSQVSLVTRTKLGVDSLSFDDLYNNLRVFKSDVKGSTGSSFSAQNVAFVSSKSTSSTNDISTAYDVSTPSGYNSQMENSSSYTDEFMYSLFDNQTNGPQLDHEDLEQLDERRDAGNTRYKAKDNRRRPRKQEEPKALVTLDGEGVDWTGHAEDEQENFALMAYSNSGSDTEEKIRFIKIDLDDKTDGLTYHKKLLAEAVKEKEELKTKLENFLSSSKGLSKLLNNHMSKRDKSGLGYGDQVPDGVLSYENEVFQCVFDSRSSDVKDSPVHDRFANVEGMHAVPPLMTGIYMPSGPDREVDDSMFTYGPKHTKTSESDTQTNNFDSCESNSSVETLESMPEPVVVEPKVVSQSKVWSDAPIIEEYESDSDDEYVIQPSKEKERPSYAFVKHVKTPRKIVKEQNTYSPSPKGDKRDWNCLMSKRLGLGYRFTKKACFVCGSFSHLIRDCDFHEKRMAKQFVPTVVLTRTGRIPVNTASHNFNSQAVSTSADRKVNVVRPIMNENRPRNNFHKTHSPIRRPFNRTTTPRTKFSNQKVNTAEVKAVSAVGGKRETVVKPSACCNWRPKRHYWNRFSKYNGGSNSRKCDNPQRALKNKGIVDSGCSRHMTGNKAYLAEYQDYNGGPITFRELQHFNLFSVSQMCDKKNKVLFTDTECLVLSSDFKLPDENQVLLRIPRQNNMYSFNIENIVPFGGLACLIAKATIDESNKWHRRLGHVNFKNLNKLVKGNLVRGLPSKIFQNNHTCVACQKGKQHKASWNGPNWLFDLDYLTKSMNYQPVRSENQANKIAGPKEANHSTGTQDNNDAGNSEMEAQSAQEYFVLPIWSSYTSTVKSLEAKNEGEKPNKNTSLQTNEEPVDLEDQAFLEELERVARATSTNIVNTDCTPLSTDSPSNVFSTGGPALNISDQDDSQIPALEDIYDNLSGGIFTNASYDDEGAVADITNLETIVNVSPIPTSRIHSIHPSTQILGDPKSAVQTRSKVHKSSGAYAFKISEALEDESWVDAMQEELLQFKIQKVWILVDLPYGKKAIGTKWVYSNKKDERGIVVRNKARLVAQGYRQEEGINYYEVFIPVARTEAIRIFLAFASYMGFIVYQMDVKSAFLYGIIDEEVYVSEPPVFVDPKFPKKVYKVMKALYGLHQAPRAWYATLSTFLLKSGYRRGTIDKTLFIKNDKNDIMLVQVYVDDIIFGSTKRSWCDEFEALMKSRFQMSSMGELTFFLGLQVKQKEDGIFISQDKYVAEILKKFDFVSVKTASTPIKTQKSLTKDKEVADVDVHRYRSMIGSLMYLTASRPDIMFAVYVCSRFQVTPKTSHLNAVKRIFSDYAGANLDRKSTTGGCQFLGRRLISWQCKKQTIVATSTTEVEYVAAANCCGQNPVFHSKTKHIEIRHHFIRDAYEKKLIQVLKIHTNDNVADLLTKAFDVNRLRATYGVELVSAASLVNIARATLSTARLVSTARQSWCCQAKLVLPGIKVGAARQKFVLLVTVTTVGEHNRFSLINYNR